MILLKSRYKECGLAKTAEKPECSALFTKRQSKGATRTFTEDGVHSARDIPSPIYQKCGPGHITHHEGLRGGHRPWNLVRRHRESCAEELSGMLLLNAIAAL